VGAKRARAGSSKKAGEGEAAGGGGGGEEEEDDDDDDAGGGGAGGDPASGLSALPDQVKYSELAVLPTVIRMLVQRRRQVKAVMSKEADAAKREALDIRQKALKILANSMYGCLGFVQSRFYAKALAALVTAQGRDILQRTVQLAESTLGCEVIYGDTDSIMIYTGKSDIKEVRAMGAAVKREVNKLYKTLEIEIDGIFASMLLLKKKKYAALVVAEGPGGVLTMTREMKGLDMVRRDWCVLSRDLGTAVLDIILSGKERDEIVDGAAGIHSLLSTAAADMRAGRTPLDKFVITKGLNKSPHDYPDVKGQPHLQVALALIKAGKNVNIGDHIPFVICREPVGTADRAGAPAAAAAAAARRTATR
jgi:DNA polymerase alpha subunit A